ncbi:MAG: HutD family protein [Pseudomonadota bacterium]|nr:HutD family protein [Pseudomonadota bacterium]
MSRVLRAAGLPVSRWPNGAGRKADLLTGDGWLIGFAWLDADAPFSMLTGMDRTITLVEGPGFTLDVAGQALSVEARFEPTCFDGGAVTACQIAGPSRVLNAMTERARFRHAVAIVDQSGRIDPGAAIACVAVVLDGVATIGDVALGRLDAMCLDAENSLELGESGSIAVVTVEPV